jgi:proteasome lid subunit RPN8/RPN11
MSSIVLTAEHRRAIAKHGEASDPNECRGLLLGRQNGTSKQVVDLVSIDDVSEPQEYRYRIPEKHMQEQEQLARTKELEIIGSFHSHVDQPARPSVYDRDQAGVRQGRAHELAAWKLSADGTAFFQEDIRSS